MVLVITFLLGFAYPKGCSNSASAERSEAVSLDIQIKPIDITPFMILLMPAFLMSHDLTLCNIAWHLC